MLYYVVCLFCNYPDLDSFFSYAVCPDFLIILEILLIIVIMINNSYLFSAFYKHSTNVKLNV